MGKTIAIVNFLGGCFVALNLGCGVHESRNLTEEMPPSAEKPAQISTEQIITTEIQSGDLPAITRRLDIGLDVNLRLDQGRTPLMVSAMWGKIEIAKLLLLRGANVDLLDETGKDVWAYAEGNAEFIRLLPNRVSLEKRLELFELVTAGNYRGLKAELDTGLDPNLRDENGRTLLIAGVYARQRAVVATLARYPGIDLNLKDSEGKSAREVAEALGEQQILRELIARGAL